MAEGRHLAIGLEPLQLGGGPRLGPSVDKQHPGGGGQFWGQFWGELGHGPYGCPGNFFSEGGQVQANAVITAQAVAEADHQCLFH